MFEYQSEQATRRHYNFESPIFSLSADYCLEDIMDALDSINAFVFEDDFECNCNQHEIDMFFESVSTELFWREIFIVKFKHAEYELMHELFIHSVDSRVGF